jgi:hypothetical protein
VLRGGDVRHQKAHRRGNIEVLSCIEAMKHLMRCWSILFALLSLAGCAGPLLQGDGWKVVGQLTDGLHARFVEVAPAKIQDRETYDKAVATLCQQQRACVLGFFAPGDRTPPTQTSQQYFDGGGWKDYPVLAVWSGSAGFTRWDCDRAGVVGAPLEALCGAGILESFSAILEIGTRTGMAKACHWPSTDWPAVAANYIASIRDVGRKEQFQRAYESSYSKALKGPRDPADCKRLRSGIERDSNQAVITLKKLRGRE